MIHYLVTRKHHYTVKDYLEQSWGQAFKDRIRLMHYSELPEHGQLQRGSYIFSDVDRLGAVLRARAIAAWNSLRETGRGTHLLNNPARVRLRHKLLRILHRRGINRFQAFRADADAEARFPVFLREKVAHSGNLTPLIKSRTALERVKARLVGEGHELRKLLTVEYCGTRDDTGYIRKYSAFIVGKEIIPRYLTVSKSWMVKYDAMIVTPETAREELEFMHANPHRDLLARIFAVARIDYGRIDYGMLDGNPQVWEINMNPTIGAPQRTQPPSEKRKREVAMRLEFTTLFYQRFAQALERLAQ